MPIDECIGDNAHHLSRNESIGGDHLSEQPVLHPHEIERIGKHKADLQLPIAVFDRCLAKSYHNNNARA
jgi:hypothetical protein